MNYLITIFILYSIISFMQNLWKLTTLSLLSVISKNIFFYESNMKIVIIYWIDILLNMCCSFPLYFLRLFVKNDLMMKIRVIPDDNNHYLFFVFFFLLLFCNWINWFLDDWITEIERKNDKLIEYRSQWHLETKLSLFLSFYHQ